MDKTSHLNWELSIIAKAIHYKNLSGASTHVGLSQPQLSRIVARLEKEFGVVLLDRSVKRKAAWTNVAAKLADVFMQNSKRLESEIVRTVEGSEPTFLRIGALEGLIDIASRFSKDLLANTKAEVVELDVHDLSVIEELFTSGQLDFVFTSREPGKGKPKFEKLLGYQILENVGTKGYPVMSPYEFHQAMGHKKSKVKAKTLVSNSLLVRRYWIEGGLGNGVVPTEVYKTPKGNDPVPVLLLAQSELSQQYWDFCSSYVG